MGDESQHLSSPNPPNHLREKALFLRDYFQLQGDIPQALRAQALSPLQLIEWKETDPWFRKMLESHREMIVDAAAMKILSRGANGEEKGNTALKALAQISSKYDTDYRKVVAVQEAVARARGYLTQSSQSQPWQQQALPEQIFDPVMQETSRKADAIIDAEFQTIPQNPKPEAEPTRMSASAHMPEEPDNI